MKKGIKPSPVKELQKNPPHPPQSIFYDMHSVLSGYCSLSSQQKQLIEGAIEQIKLNPQMEKDYINRFKNY